MKLLTSIAFLLLSSISFAETNIAKRHQNLKDISAAKQLLNLEKKPEFFVGTVQEILHADKYSYLKVENAAKKSVWAATYAVKFKIGTKIRFPLLQAMENFQSTMLNRKFAKIYFLSDYEIARSVDDRSNG